MAQRVGKGIALLFHDCGTRRGWVVSSTLWPLFTPGKYPVPIVQEAGWAPGPVWTDGKSLHTGIRSPEGPAHSQSLYRLSYLAHKTGKYIWKCMNILHCNRCATPTSFVQLLWLSSGMCFYEGYITNETKLMYKYEILSFKRMIRKPNLQITMAMGNTRK